MVHLVWPISYYCQKVQYLFVIMEIYKNSEVREMPLLIKSVKLGYTVCITVRNSNSLVRICFIFRILILKQTVKSARDWHDARTFNQATTTSFLQLVAKLTFMSRLSIMGIGHKLQFYCMCRILLKNSLMLWIGIVRLGLRDACCLRI